MGKIIISTTICDGDLGEGWTSNADAAEAYRDFLEREWGLDLAAHFPQHAVEIRIGVQYDTSGGSSAVNVIVVEDGMLDWRVEDEARRMLQVPDYWQTFCENPPPEIVSRIDGDTLVRRVEDAIADSSREDRTVTLADEPGLRDELLVASDDNAEVDGVVQYWGTDDEGRPWRVHVALALDA